MNDSYNNYIKERLRNGNNYSAQYRSAITAVDYYGAEGTFYLLQFYYSECLLFQCYAKDSNQQKRVGIVSWKRFEHKLCKMFKNISQELTGKYEQAFYVQFGTCVYDPFYDTFSPNLSKYREDISHALQEIEFDTQLPVYVCGLDRYMTKSVMYALQKKGSMVVMMQKKDDLALNEAKRVLHLLEFGSIYLQTTSVLSIADCFAPRTVYIPLVEKTLDSEFCNGKTWRDLLTGLDTDDCCIVNHVPCKCVTIKMNIDIFNNIFCSIHNNGGHQKTILLHNALGVEFPTEKDEILTQPTTSSGKAHTTLTDSRDGLQAESHASTDKAPNLQPPKEMNTNNEAHEIQIRKSPQEAFGPVKGYEGLKLETDGAVPYNIEDLFGYYLLDNEGVSEISFRDAYLYQNIDLLEAFIYEILAKLGEKLTKFHTFKIITLPDEVIEKKNKDKLASINKKGTPSEEQDKKTSIIKRQLQKLNTFHSKITDIGKKFKSRNITLVREFLNENDPEGEHKRTMVLDNGWCIDLEGGLNKLFRDKNEMDNAKCGKTTLYYYHKGDRVDSSDNPYKPPKEGKTCIVKEITSRERNLTPERLFKHYLLYKNGTFHITLRDRYLLANPEMLKTFINKLIGISRRANKDNRSIKIVNHFTLYISRITKDNQEFFNRKFANMRDDGVLFELKELSAKDKEGNHKRTLKFEDNGWCIDLEGGLDRLYDSETDMRVGICRNTTLYYCEES